MIRSQVKEMVWNLGFHCFSPSKVRGTSQLVFFCFWAFGMQSNHCQRSMKSHLKVITFHIEYYEYIDSWLLCSSQYVYTKTIYLQLLNGPQTLQSRQERKAPKETQKDRDMENQPVNCYSWLVSTLPETNIAIAPKNGWLEYYFPFGKAYFQGLC